MFNGKKDEALHTSSSRLSMLLMRPDFESATRKLFMIDSLQANLHTMIA
jgi:hypothetical protein